MLTKVSQPPKPARSLMSRSFTPTFLSTVALMAVCTTTQAANLPRDTEATWTVGANIMIDSTPYDVEDAEIMILPSIIYDNNKVYARGSQIGGYLINTETDKVNVFLQPEGSYFDPDNVNGAAKGLDERERSAQIGASYTRSTPIGGFRLQAGTDITGNSGGTVAKLAYLTRFTSDNLTIYPTVGVAWYDESHNDYYYGISEEESARTGLAAYDAESSINPYISINANYQVNEHWAGFFGQNFTYVANEQYESPMVIDRVTYRTTLGVTYTF